MVPDTLATEATLYLEAVDLFRSLELDVRWRPEAAELERPSPAPQILRPSTCERCAYPLVRINGRHICLRS